MQITQTGDITPALLTELLTSCGVLRGGAATAVTLDMESAQMGFVSDVAAFSVTYSASAGPGAPRRLFLKITKPELHPEYRAAGAHEVTFYRDILATMHDLPVAACYYAEWDAAARRAALLLDDLSQSHFQRPIPVVPPLLQCERIVESLAHIHARWWRHPQLGSTIGAPLQAAEAEASIERVHAGFAPFLDQAAVQQAYDQLAGAKAAYGARERVVEFQHEGQKIVGTLTLPEGGEAPYPVVLFFQGFLSTRDELPVTGVDEPLLTRTARLLAERGIASLRIDYRGFGDSEGKREDLTFTGLIDDSLAAIDYLATLREIDMQRLGLLGLSTGGMIAAETAARDPRVRSVVLWSPVANPPEDAKSNFGADKVAAGLQSGGEPVHLVLPWGEEIDLKTPFFEDVYSINPVAAISTVKSPLLVVVGRNDANVTPQPQYGQLYLNYHTGDERLLTVDGDHIFDMMSERGPEVLDDVIAWSLAWLLQAL